MFLKEIGDVERRHEGWCFNVVSGSHKLPISVTVSLDCFAVCFCFSLEVSVVVTRHEKLGQGGLGPDEIGAREENLSPQSLLVQTPNARARRKEELQAVYHFLYKQ